MKKTLKITARIFGVLLILIVVLGIVIQTTTVQNFIVDKVTNSLSNTLGTKVEIGEVDFDFFNKVEVRGIFAADQNQDTLLALDHLSASIGLFSLLDKKIYLDNIEISKLTSNLSKSAADSLFNFQFIIDAFAVDSTTIDTTATPTALWEIQFGAIKIADTQFSFRDSVANLFLKTSLPLVETKINNFDALNQSIDLDLLQLTNPQLDLETVSNLDTASQAETAPLAFPYSGWNINTDQVILSQGDIRYWINNQVLLKDKFDVNHLHLKEANLAIDNFLWDSTTLQLNLAQLTAHDRSGLELRQFSSEFSMNHTGMEIQNLKLKTPQSNIENSTAIAFDSWSALPDFLNQVELVTSFKPSRLALQDLEYFIPYIPKDYRVNAPIQVSGNLQTLRSEVNFTQLKIDIGDLINIRTSGKIEQITQPEKMQADLNLNVLKLNYKKLRTALPILNLPPNADALGNLRISGKFIGGMEALHFENLSLTSDAYTRFSANGQVSNLSQPDLISFELQIDTLLTRADDLALFSTTELPPGLYEMNGIDYSGKFNGTLSDIETIGTLSTAIGSLNTDIKVNFNNTFTNAAYLGTIELNDFQLGRFLQDTLGFGSVSLNINVDGQGISPDSLQGQVKANVQALEFQNYNYQNITVNGNINQLKFLGNASMNDPNLSFEFDGLVNLNEENPVFEFKAQLDTIDVAALQLTDQNIRASAVLVSNFSGNNIDDFLGQATIQDLHLSNEDKHFALDSLLLKANKIDAENKELILRSEILKANFAGDFNILDLPAILQNYINDYFPVDQVLSPIDKPNELALEPYPQSDLPEQNVQFEINIIDPVDLVNLFDPSLTRLDSAQLSGSFNTEEKSIRFTLAAPLIEAAGWIIDSLQWTNQGDLKNLHSNIRLASLSNGATTLKNNQVKVNLADKKARGSIYVENQNQEPVFEWGAKVTPSGDDFELVFYDSLMVDQKPWTTNKDAQILFGSNYLNIKDFSINKEKQKISIQASDQPQDEDFTPVKITFDHFSMEEVSSITNIEGFDFAGALNGQVVLNDITKNLHYFADLELQNLMINDSLIGSVDLEATQNSTQPIIDIDLALRGNGNQMTAEGKYNIETTAIELQSDIQQIPLILADPFTLGAIKNSQGFINGQIFVQGTVSKPDVEGYLGFDETTTTIAYLQTRYKIPEGRILLSNNRIDFDRIKLLDLHEHPATLGGYVAHQFFSDYKFFLNFETDRFRFLNTEAGDNELFYGQLQLAADVEIRGTLDLPVININARSLEDTKLTVSAVVEEQAGQQADYIIYGKPGQLPLDSVLQEKMNSSYGTPKIDLLLNLDLTPDAELIVLVDPVSGDQLSTRGTANLTVRMTPGGDVSVLGTYIAVSGAYEFSYQNLVKRSFQLREGSTLSFVGDPLDTRFDLTALYKTKTSLYSLIGNESNLSEATEQFAKDRSEVQVLLTMEGDLSRPQLSFDIQTNEDIDSRLSSTVDQKLAQLRENEAELNKQVFGLLLLNSFVAEQSASAGLSTAGENIALSSVSSLISNQLNQLSERYLEGIGLTFDLESYRAQTGDNGSSATRTNLNVGLTRSLFNDRLTIKIGGVVQVNNTSDSSSESSGYSNIAGDFVLEYQIDKSGNYILRVFQRSDYDAFEDSNATKTGAGVSFKKSFGQ